MAETPHERAVREDREEQARKKKPKSDAKDELRKKIKKVLEFMHPGGAGVPISKVKKDLEKAGFKGK